MGSGERVKRTGIHVSQIAWCTLFPVESSSHGSTASGIQILQEEVRAAGGSGAEAQPLVLLQNPLHESALQSELVSCFDLFSVGIKHQQSPHSALGQRDGNQ